jgi:hypothetical protein
MDYFAMNSNSLTPPQRKGFPAWARILIGAVTVGFIGVTTAQSVRAISYAESGDAGQTIGTAQNVGGSIDQINGTISPGNDVDLYEFSFNSNVNFTASTVGLANFDTELFLFNSLGGGIIANDDALGFQSIITGSLSAGTYYLAIGSFDLLAIDGEGDAWQQSSPTGLSTPPSNFGTLAFFDAGGSETGTYGISLSPATSSAAAVPFEFSPSLGLLLVGAGFGIKRGRNYLLASRNKLNPN